MKLVHAIIFGFFIAIILYLGLKNATGAAAILNAGGTQINNSAKTLQGR